jgi:hypothetical protein
MVFILLITSISFLFAVSAANVFGHGVGSETLPPQMLGDRKVAMEVSSTVDNATSRKQIVFSMFDTNTGITIRDVTYKIKAIKNDQTLFEGIYQTKNGVLTLDFIPDQHAEVTVQEKKDSGVFGFLTGTEQSLVEAKGKIFEESGLYKFSIDVVSAEHYSAKTQKPVLFESGLSFADTVIYEVNDAQYGPQELKVVSYYDVLDEVGYGPKTKSVFFSMPFEWSADNINQTSVVHQEIFIPKTFGALQVSDYEVSVNGFVLAKDAFTIDDFVDDYRVIHILLYQTQLENIFAKQQNTQNKLNFLVMPKSNDLLLSSVTKNIQYKIAMTTMPNQIASGQEATLLFKIYDVFLQGKIVSASYDLAVTSGDTNLYRGSGISSTADEWNKVTFNMPGNAENKILVRFENVGGNSLAIAELPLIILHTDMSATTPSWIKNNAGWWCQKLISDDDFLKGIEYLIKEGIIPIDEKTQSSDQKAVPQWVRNNACWWANDSISDNEFINGIAYLVKNGMIHA